MKRFFFAAMALLLVLPLAGQQALSGKHFTEEEMLGRIPEGIVKPTPFVMGFEGESLQYMAGRDVFSYSPKTSALVIVRVQGMASRK